MKYEKPQVVSLSALDVVRATSKTESMYPDSQSEPRLVTVTAYEADE